MCLIGLALDAHPRWRLVIAANRDEYFDRPAAPLDWWRSDAGSPWLLGGRDLSAGGTWLALSASGRIGALTNVRDRARQRTGAASRGTLVTRWLDRSELPPSPSPTNPFNLIGGDLHSGRWWWTSDRHPVPALIAPGVHALSNGALNEPWPKVRWLTQALQQALSTSGDDTAFASQLLAMLEDRTLADDADLPDTGIGRDAERRLSPAFIHLPQLGYGTRCSSVVVGRVDDDGRWRLHWVERTHGRDGLATATRSIELEHWPHEGDRPAVTERTFSAA